MALTIRSVLPAKAKLLTVTLIATFALVAQPFYGMVQTQVANAVSNADTRSIEVGDLSFGVNGGKDYMRVSFTAKNFGNVKSAKVQLMSSDTPVATNTAKSRVIGKSSVMDLVSNKESATISSPFYMPATYSLFDIFRSWDSGNHTWKVGEKPDAVVVTITDEQGDKVVSKDISVDTEAYESRLWQPASKASDLSTDVSGDEVSVKWNYHLLSTDTFEYRLNSDDETIQTTGSERVANVTDLTNGDYKVEVRSVSSAGVASEWSDAVNFSVKVDPTITIDKTSISKGKLTVNGSVTHNDSRGLNRIYLQLVERSTGKRCGGFTIHLIGKPTDGTWTHSYNLTDIKSVEKKPVKCGDGLYAAHASVVDRSGLDAKVDDWTPNFPLDTTAPVMKGVTSDGEDIEGKILRGEHDFQVNFEEGDLAGAYVEYNVLKDGSWKKPSEDAGRRIDTANPVLTIDTSRWDDGPARIKITDIEDEAGNRTAHNAAQHTVRFTVDNDAPVVTLDEVQIKGDKLSFKLGATDTGSGLKHVATNIEDESGDRVISLGKNKDGVDRPSSLTDTTRLNTPFNGWGVGERYEFEKTLSGIDISNLAPGTYTILGYAKDNADRTHRFATAKFTVEDKGDEDGKDGEVSTPVKLTVEGTTKDSISGTAEPGSEVTVYVNGTQVGTVTTLQDGTWVLTGLSLENGHRIEVRADYTDEVATHAVAGLSGSDRRTSGNSDPLPNPADEDSLTGRDFMQPATPAFPLFSTIVNADSENDDEDGEVLGARTDDDNGSNVGEILGAAADTDTNEGSGGLLGLAWYWWLVIVAGVGLASWMFLAAMRRKREDTELGL